MYSAPVVDNGRLFIGDRRGYLHARDAKTGHRIWKLLTSRAENNDVNGPPLVRGDRVYVATNAGRFLCIDAATGKIHWNLYLRNPSINEILVHDNVAIICDMVALNWVDIESGILLARKSLPRQSYLKGVASKGLDLFVAISSDSKKVSSSEGTLFGFHGSDLVFEKPHNSGLTSLSWLSTSQLLECRYDGLGILNPKDGSRLQTLEFPDLMYFDPVGIPTEHGNRLYGVSNRGIVFALRWPPNEG
jgi:hypothetical protein